MPNGLFSVFPGFGMSIRLTGWGFLCLTRCGCRRSALSNRCLGWTDLTPSIPAVFWPWFSRLTRRTALSRAALDAHQEFLECVDCSHVTTLFGSKDALLYPVHMLLKLAPGQRAPTLTLRIRWQFPLHPGCLRLCHTTCASFFQIIVPTLAYLGHYP